ncbi:response regulator [Lewinella sp. IMCC34183]|uniref:response regulator n=1 Tax=Lewinella sp. IMCC34183 TaxID=2248762 RepID=UPI001E5D2D9E|nr:response regulator [Lewinella sp. IMCC34183]
MNIANEIVVRHNGREGLRYFTTPPSDGSTATRPDLLFLDINMPVMDGWEFLDAYRELPAEQRARVTILMITSSIGEGDQERSRQFTCIDGHEPKPLTREKLRNLLTTHFPDFSVDHLD